MLERLESERRGSASPGAPEAFAPTPQAAGPYALVDGANAQSAQLPPRPRDREGDRRSRRATAMERGEQVAHRGARNDWVCTARRDGRRHAKPAWVVWLVFSTHRDAYRSPCQPTPVVHRDSGDQVVIDSKEGHDHDGSTVGRCLHDSVRHTQPVLGAPRSNRRDGHAQALRSLRLSPTGLSDGSTRSSRVITPPDARRSPRTGP
jgi:hypothetical protein